MLSFPDSNNMNSPEYQISYTFIMKRGKNSHSKQSYGYTYFFQKKDKTQQRGYLMRAIVILSDYPFIQFFLNLTKVIGKQYFDGIYSPKEKQNNDSQAAKLGVLRVMRN